MLPKLAILVLAGAALVASLAQPNRLAIAADEQGPLVDSDLDFVPDAVEWVVLTSANNPDTDGDQISDFVEIVQRSRPRRVSEPLPADQEMRILVTGPAPGSPDPTAWLHLMVRLVGAGAALQSFQAWCELPSVPGVRFGFDLLSLGPAVMRSRDAGPEGTWLTLSVPLASTCILHLLAPLSLHAESTIAGRTIHSAVNLFDMQGELSTLVPFDQSGFAVQRIGPPIGGGGNLTNRVCVLDLAEVGSGPGGTIYEIAGARCDDCNEVECAPSCPQSVGWLVTIPGGLGTLGSN